VAVGENLQSAARGDSGLSFCLKSSRIFLCRHFSPSFLAELAASLLRLRPRSLPSSPSGTAVLSTIRALVLVLRSENEARATCALKTKKSC